MQKMNLCPSCGTSVICMTFPLYCTVIRNRILSILLRYKFYGIIVNVLLLVCMWLIVRWMFCWYIIVLCFVYSHVLFHRTCYHVILSIHVNYYYKNFTISYQRKDSRVGCGDSWQGTHPGWYSRINQQRMGFKSSNHQKDIITTFNWTINYPSQIIILILI